MPDADNAPPPEVVQRLEELIEAARQDDDQARDSLRRTLDEHPEIWRHFGNLAGHAERGWIGLLAGKSPHVHESLLRQLAAMRAELAGDRPAPLEALLIDRVVISWLEVRYYELAVPAAHGGQTPTDRQAESLSRRLDAAQRRHLAAIRTLAQTRKLLPGGTPSRQAAPPGKSPSSHETAAEGGPEPNGPPNSPPPAIVPWPAAI